MRRCSPKSTVTNPSELTTCLRILMSWTWLLDASSLLCVVVWWSSFMSIVVWTCLDAWFHVRQQMEMVFSLVSRQAALKYGVQRNSGCLSCYSAFWYRQRAECTHCVYTITMHPHTYVYTVYSICCQRCGCYSCLIHYSWVAPSTVLLHVFLFIHTRVKPKSIVRCPILIWLGGCLPVKRPVCLAFRYCKAHATPTAASHWRGIRCLSPTHRWATRCTSGMRAASCWLFFCQWNCIKLRGGPRVGIVAEGRTPVEQCWSKAMQTFGFP